MLIKERIRPAKTWRATELDTAFRRPSLRETIKRFFQKKAAAMPAIGSQLQSKENDASRRKSSVDSQHIQLGTDKGNDHE